MMDLNGKLGLHAKFRHETVRIGNEGAPVLIVDDFLNAPELLVECAARHAVFKPGDASYPGVRAAMPAIYVHAMRAFLTAIVRDAFEFRSDEIVKAFCGFSLVTTPPHALDLVQRLPHFDSTEPKQIALLHYLCPASKGGTAFYRHRRTGYERIDESRLTAYTASVRAELAEHGPPPPRYVNGSDARYERIASFDAAFNRVLIYRSINLHSAGIAPVFDFDPDPRTGRLTANALFTFR